MAPERVRLEAEDGLALVVVDRPRALNALNTAVLEELRDVLRQVAQRDDVRVVILTGAGERAFVAGADIKEMESMDPLATRRFAALGHEVTHLLETLEKPVIAAVNGYALGGGCELALACDLRIASENARLGLPEVTLGILPGFGGTQRLTRLLGRGRASELILTGEPVDATTAERIGLVNRVVPPETLLEEAKALGRKLRDRGPVALKLAKAAIHQSQEAHLAAGLAFEQETFSLAFSTEDQEEGMRAFVEKRKPRFEGQ